MEKQISVLIIEDYEDDAELMVLELNKSGLIINYEVVDNENALKDALLKKKWDAIISDYKLPGFNAIGALKTIQQMKLDLPFIIVSGTIGEEIAVQAMKSGAQDYIMKSNLTRLAPALEREIREAEMRLQKKVSAEKLLEQELLLRSVVEFLPVGLVLIDRNKNIVLANKEFRNTWGNIESFNG
ncbi:MAG: response regulator, partial [Bacillota bacterium]